MKKILMRPRKSHIFAIDESSIQLITPIRKIIAPRGSKPFMKTARHFQGITVIGGIDGNGELITKIQDHPTKVDCFLDFLKMLRKNRSRGKIHIILDNASFHTRIKVRELAEKLSIILHFQPTHSPFLNAAEEIWRQLKEFVRGRLFTKLPDLRIEVEKFFKFNQKLNINLGRYLC